MSALRDLADAAGIDASYTSWGEQPVTASDEAVFATLRALAPDLGIELERIEDAQVALATLQRARCTHLVPPVVVGWDGMLTVPFTVPAGSDHDYEIEVTTEDQRCVRARGRLSDLVADSPAASDNVTHCVRRAVVCLRTAPGTSPTLATPGADGNGYHSVRWRTGGGQGELLGIVAPTLAWGGPGDRAGGGRRWGVFAPLYGLASAGSGQAGDLASLRELFAAVDKRGGRYVATLPILAAFLDEPCQYSPYSPASRLFWNELYLDLGELASLAATPAPIAEPIVAGRKIDYRAQYAWRRAGLDPIAAALVAHPVHGRAIEAYARQAGVYDYAAFRAMGEERRVGWARWPSPWRDATPFVETREQAMALGCDRQRLATHVVGQWAMQRQLQSLSAASSGRVGLYLDLPVGVNCDAYEVWRQRELFITELAAGAPPDALFLGGQNWGLPPLSPIALRRDRYRYFIRCVQHHMRVSKMLRIDHVMGLFRLYCVPAGHPATDGVYLRYAAEELLAILTLESQRNHCALVGEDLGTVPDHVRPTMTRHGLFRLHVGQWYLPTTIGEPPLASPTESVASLNTHDTATFAGWWRGTDIDDRRDLELIDAAQDLAEHVERDVQRRALLAFAGVDPSIDTLTEVERAMTAATADLALGPAEVVLVALDDLVLDPVPHNVPGTTSQRPNWQRRVERWADVLDEERAPPAAIATMTAVTMARGG